MTVESVGRKFTVTIERSASTDHEEPAQEQGDGVPLYNIDSPASTSTFSPFRLTAFDKINYDNDSNLMDFEDSYL